MNDCPDDMTLDAFVDGELPDGGSMVQSHLDTCAACRQRVESLYRLDALILQAEATVTAPDTLSDRLRRTRVERHPIAGRRQGLMSRRAAILGGALAASFGGLLVYRSVSSRSEGLLYPALTGDFRTMLAAGRPVDVTLSDPLEAERWFRDRVPFAMPSLVGVADLDIRGGRLCWLAERRCAAIDFGRTRSSFCLYLCNASGLRISDDLALPAAGGAPVGLSAGNVTGAFWRDDDVVLALVGERGAAELLRIADDLRRGRRANS